MTSHVIRFGPLKNSEREFLVKGDLCEPEDYLVCRTKNSAAHPGCKRFFLFQDKVIVKYSFDRKRLRKTKVIAGLWLGKLNDFTKRPEKTREIKP